MQGVVFARRRMPLPAGNQPAIDGKGDKPRQKEGENKASPEKRGGKPGIHGSGDDQHDRIVDHFHDRYGNRIGG